MKYKHVQQRNARFVWRLTVFGEVLRNVNQKNIEVTYSHPALAAYDCDLVKFFLREKYSLRTSKTQPSFPAEQFAERAARAGLDLSDLQAVFSSLPESAQEFLGNYGDVLKAHAEQVAAAELEKKIAEAYVPPPPAPPSFDYLEILLAALSSRLLDAAKVAHKAGQLNALNDKQRAAIKGIENKLEALEIVTREECVAILTLV